MASTRVTNTVVSCILMVGGLRIFGVVFLSGSRIACSMMNL